MHTNIRGANNFINPPHANDCKGNKPYLSLQSYNARVLSVRSTGILNEMSLIMACRWENEPPKSALSEREKLVIKRQSHPLADEILEIASSINSIKHDRIQLMNELRAVVESIDAVAERTMEATPIEGSIGHSQLRLVEELQAQTKILVVIAKWSFWIFVLLIAKNLYNLF